MLSLLCVRRLVIMADERWIWIEVENEDQAILTLDAHHFAAQRRAKDLLEALTGDGARLLEENVPTYTSYTLRHVDRTSVEWHPGGAGGGGEYESTVGIKRGTSYHPVYVNQGTGVYGPYIQQPYAAGNPSGRMWFYSVKYGRVIGVESVKGQRAQHFLYITFQELQAVAAARVLLKKF
jgi:hypothetical protein